MADPKVRADRTLAPALVKAFEESKGDQQVRRYLALAIGRLDPPMPADAVASLTQRAGRSRTAKPASASSGRWARRAIRRCSIASSRSTRRRTPTPGIRKMVVYALGALPGDAQIDTLRTALEDSAPDVRWNAAVALARHNRGEGVAVLRQMLDRGYVEQTVKRDVRQDQDQDPIADVMISGLRAAAALKDQSLKPLVSTLSQEDRSMKVRQAALEALKVIG